MYKVIENFVEKYDGGKLYLKGEVYPREGFEPTEARIKQLTTGANSYGYPFLEVIEEPGTEEVVPEVVEEPEKKPAPKKATKK